MLRVGTAHCAAYLPNSLQEKALCAFVNSGLTLKDVLVAAGVEVDTDAPAWQVTLDESTFEGCPARDDVTVVANATGLRIEFDDGPFVAFAWRRPEVVGDRLTFAYWIEARSGEAAPPVLAIVIDGSGGHPILSALDGWHDSAEVALTLSPNRQQYEIEVHWRLTPSAFLCGDVARVVRRYRVGLAP